MTIKTTKKTKPTLVEKQPENNMPINGTILGASDQLLKTIASLSAALIFAAPAQAKEASTVNILGLADFFYKYSTGEIKVTQPGEKAEEITKAN